MITLEEIRSKYPGAASLSDDELIGVTAERYGTTPDIFREAIGYKPPQGPEGGFMASVKQTIGAGIKGAGRAASDFIPGVESNNALTQYGQEVIDANPTAVRSFGDIGRRPGTAVAEATGNAAGSMAGIVGSRALGMGITAAAPMTGPLAPATALLGQAIAWFGPAAMAALPSYGGIRDKQILNDPNNEADWKSKAIAGLGAATVGAIETKFGPQQWALSALTKEGRAALAEKFAETTLAKGIGFGALKGAAVEGAEELAQNPVEQLAGYDDPTTKESLADTAFGGAMGAIGGGVFGGGTGGIIGRRGENKQNPPVPPAAPLQIGNTPDPLISFPDGTVGRRSEVDAYVNSLPEEQRVAARAKLMGMGARDATPEDILKAPDADSAIAAFTASLTGTDLGAMMGQENPLIGASRDMQAQTATDQADLADLAQTEARDLNTLRALAVEDARKQRELDALQATGTGQFGVRLDERAAVEAAATVEAPTAMQLALQRARDRAASSAPNSQNPEILSNSRQNSEAESAANPMLERVSPNSQENSQPPEIQRQPDILPGDISREDGTPFQTESGAKYKQRFAGGVDGSEIVPVQNGYVIRPKTTPTDPAAAAIKTDAGADRSKFAGNDSVSAEKPTNIGLMDAESSGNLLGDEAARNKRSDGLDGDAAPVMRHMLAIGKNLKVLKAVVKLIPVDVVNDLARAKLTPEMLFYDPSVLQRGGVRGDSNDSISIGVDAAAKVMRLVARLAAERSPALGGIDSGLGAIDGGRANNAVKGVAGLSDGSQTQFAATGPVTFEGREAGRAFVDGESALNTIDDRHVVTPTSDDVLGAVGVDAPSAPPTVSTDSGSVKTAQAQADPRLIPVSKRAPAQRDDLTDDETTAEFERLYQEDVKADIRRRLGMEPPAKEAKPKASAFRTFLRKYGINPQHASDITGERGVRANNRLPATFRRNGLGLDELALRAVESGYLTQADLESDSDNGGTNKLMEMIQAEIRGERQETTSEAGDSAEAQLESVRRAELEDMATALGIPFDAGIDPMILASMVSRVQRALDASKEPKGSTKADRVRANAVAAAQRIEAKRQKYERELEEFAKASIREQNAFLEVLMDDDGTPVVNRLADQQADDAWNELLGAWEDQNGQTETPAEPPSRQAGTPDGAGAAQRPGDAQEGDSGEQRGSDQGQEKELEAGSAEIAEAKSLKYRLPYLQRLLDGEALVLSDAFMMHLLATSLPKSREYNRMMLANNGDLIGIEFQKPNDGKYPTKNEKYAVALPDASRDGKWRVSYFDQNGFSSHESHTTREQAQQALAQEGFTIQAEGTLDRLAATDDWARGTDYADLIMDLNRGAITHAQFIEKQKSMNDSYEAKKAGGLTAPTRADVLRQQAQAEAEAQRKEQGGDKPVERKVTGDTPDMFNTQGSVFDQPLESDSTPAPAVDRFAAGKALTKEQRRAVLKTLVDVYKAKGAPREMKGTDRNGNERYGYVHSPELFERSDITGAMVRYHVTLPDGKLAHPSELFPDYTQADIDKAMIDQAAAEKQDEAGQKEVEDRATRYAKPTKDEARQSFIDRNMGFDATGKKFAYFEKDGGIYATTADDAALIKRLERGGWKPASDGAANKVGDLVKLTKPGVNGRVNIAGTITKILPDGRLEIRTQQDGYMTVAPSELGHKPTSPPAEPAAQASQILDAANITGKDRLDILKDVKSGALTPGEVQAAFPGVDAGKIEDVGEKIGGARKDTATSTGPKSKRTTDDDRPAWARRFIIAEAMRPVGQINAVPNEGRWVIRDKKNTDFMGQPQQVGRMTFASKEDAEAALPLIAVSLKHRVRLARSDDGKDVYEIWRNISDRKSVKVVDRQFESNDAAKQYMAENATAIIEANTTFGEADLPIPDSKQRIGEARRTGNVTGESFRDVFGFRAVEFGNWNNQDERQQVMNEAYDGLLDLAEVVGIPPKAIGLNGDLALAFGARGQGLHGARAHYENRRAVINLTKMDGAGALAHEWFHGLDHYFGRQDGKTPGQWKVEKDGTRTFDAKGGEADMASGGFLLRGSGVRKEVQDAYEAMVKTMFKKAATYVEDTEKADKFVAATREDLAEQLNKMRAELSEQKDVRYYKRKNAPAPAEMLAEFDDIASKFLAGEFLDTELRYNEGNKSKRMTMAHRWTNDALDRINAIYKETRGRSGFNTEQNGWLDGLRGYMTRYSQRLKMLADAQQATEKTKSVPTEFAMDAKSLDQGRGKDYWTTPHEMLARAFQGYVEDKIAEKGGKSPFLNFAPANAGILTPWGWKRPYPYGEERTAINGAIDKFVKALKTEETDTGIALREPDAEYLANSPEQADNAPYETDLFGQPLPPPAGRTGSTRPTSAGVRGNVQPASGVQDTPAPAGEYFASTLVGSEVSRELGARRITTPEQAAQATSYLYKSAVERMDGIVTDKDGKPLAIVGGFKGALAQAPAYPATLMAEAVRIPGAAKIWFSHNHPSGNPELSNADRRLGEVLSDVFYGSGIEPMGMLAIGSGRFSHIMGGNEIVSRDIPTSSASVSVPVIERTLAPNGVTGVTVSSLSAAKQYARDFYDRSKKPGLILLNTQNSIIGWVPITDQMTGELRGTGGLNAIYRAISESNAGGAIIVHGGELGFQSLPRQFQRVTPSENIAAALAKIDVRPLDSIEITPMGAKSTAESGLNVASGPVYARSTQGRGVNIDDAKAVVASVREALPTAPTIYIMESVAQAPADLRKFIKAAGAENDVDAAYHNGEIYVFPANIPSIERMQFVLAHHEIRHHGLASMLGPRKNAVMLKIHESNPKIGALAAEQVRKGYAKSRILATEEALADMPVADLVKLNGFDRIVAAVREWLRGAAARLRRAGLGNIADAIDAKEWTDRDVAALIARAEGVSRGGSARYASEGTVFDRDDGAMARTGDQTSTPAFKKWFAGSKVVDAQGRPLVVYHGTDSDFATFNAGRGDLGKGIYFASAADDAASYASPDGRGANVMPVYVSIQNPYYWTKEDRNKSADKVNAAARRAGHDGIIRTWADSDEKHIIAFDPAQVKSAIGNNGDFDPANPDIRFARSVVTGATIPQAWQAPDPSKMDDFLYAMQDRHIDTKRVVTAVRDAIGGIADNLDPYLQEELYHGRAAKATKDFLEQAIRPLMVDMQARGVEMSDFEEYLHNRHAERRNVQVAKVNPNMPDGGSGIKTADARAYLSGLSPAKRTAYQALSRRVDQMNRDTRALLVSSGLEKQSTIDAWQAAYGDEYVPLMREEMDNGMMGIGQGFSVRGSSSKRAMGSDKPVANIMANIALQREKAITRAEKRRIGEALYGMVLSAPNPDFWIAVDPALQQSPAQITATSMQLISMGMNPVDAQAIAAEPTQRYVDPRTGQVASRINPALRSADNVLAVRIDGEDKYVFFNARDERAMRMAKALKNLDADQLGTVMGNVAKVTRYFAAVNTQYNPIFGIVNLTRDIQTALLNLQSTGLAGKQAEVMKHVGSALRGIYIDLRDHRAGKTPTSTWASLFEEFQQEGGATGYRDMYANAQERAGAIADELKKVKQGKAMEFGRGVFGWLSDYNESMENAVRLATYKVAKEQGMSSQQAASIAKNLTVNFNRKGQVALQAGAMYAFFNAAVQGTARMAETMFAGGKLSATGKKIMTGGLLLGSMQALLLAAAGYDDEEPPDFVRERSLVLPIGGDKYVSIPMPLGFHVIPNLARIPTEWALGGFRDTPKRLAQLVGLFADAFNPIGSAGLSLQTLAPTIIDPLAALAENRDWTGKPIAKKDFNSMQPTAGHTRAKDTATPWGRAIAYGVNWVTGGTDYKPGMASPTPDQIDYLIGQATGGVGREVSKLSQVAGSTVSGEELPLYKIPLLGRFVGTTAGQAAESGRFYENLKQIGEHDAELSGLKKDRRMAEYQEYMRDNPEARLVPIADRTYREVSKLIRMKRDALKAGASTERIKMLDQQITARMAAFNQRVKATETRETATQE